VNERFYNESEIREQWKEKLMSKGVSDLMASTSVIATVNDGDILRNLDIVFPRSFLPFLLSCLLFHPKNLSPSLSFLPSSKQNLSNYWLTFFFSTHSFNNHN